MPEEITCPKCGRTYEYSPSDVENFNAIGECHNCYAEVDYSDKPTSQMTVRELELGVNKFTKDRCNICLEAMPCPDHTGYDDIPF